MKRPTPTSRRRRVLNRTLQVLGPMMRGPRVDGRVTLAVLWALGRLAQRLGPA